MQWIIKTSKRKNHLCGGYISKMEKIKQNVTYIYIHFELAIKIAWINQMIVVEGKPHGVCVMSVSGYKALKSVEKKHFW